MRFRSSRVFSMRRARSSGRHGLTRNTSSNGGAQRASPLPSVEIDLRVGGRFTYCMRTPDGHDFYNGGEFLRDHSPRKDRLAKVVFGISLSYPREPIEGAIPKAQFTPTQLSALSFRTCVSNMMGASLRGHSARLAGSLGARDIAKPRDPNWIALGKACRRHQRSTLLSDVIP